MDFEGSAEEMNQPSTQRIRLLAMLSGLMLGCSFPPIPLGILATLAFVPFFIVLESIEKYGDAFRISYLTFLVFNAIAIYWPGGFVLGKDWYMMTAGLLLLLAHPLFFCVPVLAWMFIRQRFGFKVSLLTFPFLWVSFEYLHSLSDLAFPWLTIGNTQSYTLSAIQFASYTGVYGISFWLLCLNLIAYYLYAKLALGEWTPKSSQSIACVILFFLLYALPRVQGRSVLEAGSREEASDARRVRVALIQPNIDPFEKWESRADLQLATLQQMTSQIDRQNVDLVLWPETAIPFYILEQRNDYLLSQIKRQVDTLDVSLLTGMPDIVYYSPDEKIPNSSRKSASGERYDSFNSSVLLQPYTAQVQKYSKILLVPFAERVPFSEELSFLNAMEWNFGLGGWGVGKDTAVFVCHKRDGSLIKFSNLICFESVYPGFVSQFVRKGAQFLTVITNDSWWGNTSGPYQHEQLTVLRAVENRRWIAVCGNGGISCIIDPFGHRVRSTEFDKRLTLVADLQLRNEMTFYSKHGDWFPELCLWLSLCFLTAGLGRSMYIRIRMKQEDEVH